MTVAAARAKGLAVAQKGVLGWQARCEICPWTHIVSGFSYKSDATAAADEHNADVHGVKR